MKKTYDVRNSTLDGARRRTGPRRRNSRVSRSSNWVRRFSAAGLCFLVVVTCAQVAIDLFNHQRATIDPSLLAGMAILSASFNRVWSRGISRGKQLWRLVKRIGNDAGTDRARAVVDSQEPVKHEAEQLLRQDKAKKKSKMAIDKKVLAK